MRVFIHQHNKQGAEKGNHRFLLQTPSLADEEPARGPDKFIFLTTVQNDQTPIAVVIVGILTILQKRSPITLFVREFEGCLKPCAKQVA